VQLSYVECCQYEKYAFLSQDDETILSNTSSQMEKIKTTDERRVLSVTPVSDNGSAYISFAEGYSKDSTAVGFDFKVFASETDMTGVLFDVNFGTDAEGWQLKNTASLSGANMKIGNADISVGKWYRAIYIFDFTKKCYQLYVTDISESKTVLAADYIISATTFKNLGKIEFVTGKDNTVYIDSLKVFKPSSYGFTILSPGKNAVGEEHLAATVPNADKVVFMLNGRIISEYNGGGTYSVMFDDVDIKNGKNHFEVFAFTGEECQKESVTFTTDNEVYVNSISYTKDGIDILMNEKCVMPANCDEIVLKFKDVVSAANVEIADRFGNVISNSTQTDGSQVRISLKKSPEQGAVIYAVVKSGTSVGGSAQSRDVYYPIFVAADDGLYVSPFMYSSYDGGNVIFEEYGNLADVTVERKMYVAEYENDEKLYNLEIQKNQFVSGENRMIQTENSNKKVLKRKAFILDDNFMPLPR